MVSSTANSYKVNVPICMQCATAAWRDVSKETIFNFRKHMKEIPAPGIHKFEEEELEYTCNMVPENDANSLFLLLVTTHLYSPMAVLFLLM